MAGEAEAFEEDEEEQQKEQAGAMAEEEVIYVLPGSPEQEQGTEAEAAEEEMEREMAAAAAADLDRVERGMQAAAAAEEEMAAAAAEEEMEAAAEEEEMGIERQFRVEALGGDDAPAGPAGVPSPSVPTLEEATAWQTTLLGYSALRGGGTPSSLYLSTCIARHIPSAIVRLL